ncbi:hypothetical protein AGLY_005751 [Aphis glycines]|uniref:Uncharacterized protein n=1 Tax=Aphis glycines TaxID=307491 RepID=A0A6G0TTP9_APHGL|nr:hypothetical protein AGLY_005751 [Aphis glycines]
MSATCWQNVSADNCGRCLDDQCRPPAAFHVLFRPSNGVAGDDDDEKGGWGCPAAEPSAYGAGDLRLGVGVCDRPNAGEGCCCCCCLDDWVVERFRRNGDCCGLGVSFPPAERLRGGRVTRVTDGVPAIKCLLSFINIILIGISIQIVITYIPRVTIISNDDDNYKCARWFSVTSCRRVRGDDYGTRVSDSVDGKVV